MEDNKTIAFNGGNYYIERITAIRTKGQTIIRGVYSVLNDCYELYYEFQKSSIEGKADFKDFIIARIKELGIDAKLYENKKIMGRLIVHYVFEGLDRRTRSKYGQVLEDAFKSQPIIKPEEFEAWYKARGGLNPKDKEGVKSFEQQSDYNEFVLDYFNDADLKAFKDKPEDTEIPFIALFKIKDRKLMTNRQSLFYYNSYDNDGKVKKVFDTVLRVIMKNGKLGDAQIGKLYQKFSEAKIKAEQKEVA